MVIARSSSGSRGIPERGVALKALQVSMQVAACVAPLERRGCGVVALRESGQAVLDGVRVGACR